MTAKKVFKGLVLLVFLPFTPTMVQASYGSLDNNYQEVSYDDLVNELNSKKAAHEEKLRQPSYVSHLGIGFVHSYEQMNFNNSNSDRSQEGLQLTYSRNLDSPNLYAEGLFRNFSGSSRPQEDLQIQQFDARLGYINDLSGIWKYTLLTGFSGRFIEANNSTNQYSANEFTPAFTAGAGVMAEVHRNLRLGAELDGRTSMFGRNTDRDSFDLAVRIETSL